jgi:hypothetical protein
MILTYKVRHNQNVVGTDEYYSINEYQDEKINIIGNIYENKLEDFYEKK